MAAAAHLSAALECSGVGTCAATATAAPAEASIGLPERYDVLEHLADGGMASVWEARDDLLDRHVAVKVLAGPLAALALALLYARKRVPAATWSIFLYVPSSYAVISYTENWMYVAFAAIGSWVGAYLTITFLHRPPGGPPVGAAPE